jgi:hypothetical protein
MAGREPSPEVLRGVPDSWFSWHYTLRKDGLPVARVRLDRLREAGSIEAGGRRFRIYRKGWSGGTFFLDEDGATIARAEKPSAFSSSFVVEHAGKSYAVKKKSALGRTFVLYEGEREAGSIAPEGHFSREVVLELPGGMPLKVRAFVFSLVLVIWRRESSAAGSAGA